MKAELGIEQALEDPKGSFFEKYRLMKDRLLNVEYEHWAAGFAEGNNHGRGHITRVLEYLDYLVGPEPLKYVTRYELFLAMMSILYHDIGIIRQREAHGDISKSLLEGDANDAYIINAIDKEIIAAAVVSHSSSKDIAKEFSRFSEEEIIGRDKARPRLIAALVRLADELDEDYRRADPILQSRLNLPPESEFFWRFCQRVRGIRPDVKTKWIDFNVQLEPEDARRYGLVPGGKVRHFVAFFAEKLAKINQERIKVNAFLPTELKYNAIHVDVKPLRRHPTWISPRTFVFNDSTGSQMFLQSFPELLKEPAQETIQEVLGFIKNGAMDTADNELDKLASVLSDLPVEVRARIFYVKACIYSRKAGTFPAKSPEHEGALDQAVKYLIDWFQEGQRGAFRANSKTADAAVHDMAIDGDLAVVLNWRKSSLRKEIPESHWPTSRRSERLPEDEPTGCVPQGTFVETPDGNCFIEQLGPGDRVVSLKLGVQNERVTATVMAVRTTQSASFIQLNQRWFVTPSQPVRTSAGWVEAGMLKEGDAVMDGHGVLNPIVEIVTINKNMRVFDLTIADPHHNYVANGLLCHNKP